MNLKKTFKLKLIEKTNKRKFKNKRKSKLKFPTSLGDDLISLESHIRDFSTDDSFSLLFDELSELALSFRIEK